MSSLLRKQLLRSDSHYSREIAAMLTQDLDDGSAETDWEHEHNVEEAAPPRSPPVRQPSSDHAGPRGSKQMDIQYSTKLAVTPFRCQFLKHDNSMSNTVQSARCFLVDAGAPSARLCCGLPDLTEPLTPKERKTGTTWKAGSAMCSCGPAWPHIMHAERGGDCAWLADKPMRMP